MSEDVFSTRRRAVTILGVILLATPVLLAAGSKTEEPIDRMDLPSGLAALVGDEALDLASSESFSEARQLWDDDAALVDQIDYQLHFRRFTDFLPVDAEHLAVLFQERPDNRGIDELGLYLTDAEAAEMSRRDRIGDRIPEVESVVWGLPAPTSDLLSVAIPPSYAGVWQDQMNQGRLVVATTSPELIRARLQPLLDEGLPADVVAVDHSWGEVVAFRDSLVDSINKQEIEASVMVESTGAGRRITIATPDPDSVEPLVAQVAPKQLVDVVVGPAAEEASSPGSTHSASHQMSGLEIEVDPGGWCTWGITAHTQSYFYAITAGHCGPNNQDNFSGWTSNYEVHQNNSRHLTPGDTFVFSIHDADGDAKRFSTDYADTNCYHAGNTPDCRRFIEWRAWLNSWEVGSDKDCVSLGRSNTYRCGYILEESASPGGDCEGSRWVRIGVQGSLGDSGSGFIHPTAGGATFTALLACVGGSNTWSLPAYHVENELGIDINCSSQEIWSSSYPSSWGGCPGTDR